VNPVFDWYAFADYSGAGREAEQRKHIAWAVDRGNGIVVTQGLTRWGLLESVSGLLRAAQMEGKRVLFGFDHNYGFPQGFYEALHGSAPADWRQVLEGYAVSVASFLQKEGRGPAGANKAGYTSTWNRGGCMDDFIAEALRSWSPRDWARSVNEAIGMGIGSLQGPFWGTLFERRPEASLFGERRHSSGLCFRFRERRLVEERFRRLKPAFQLGGIGSVGQQSLQGMLHLYKLLRLCSAEGIPVHVWPQDGCRVPAGGHLAVEVYPTLALELEGIVAPRTDAGDAVASVRWMRRVDGEGLLRGLLLANFRDEQWQRVRLEGWVLGVDP
jgi:hypothetical protein